jgi:outer membrane biosynthesis protein TonB
MSTLTPRRVRILVSAVIAVTLHVFAFTLLMPHPANPVAVETTDSAAETAPSPAQDAAIEPSAAPSAAPESTAESEPASEASTPAAEGADAVLVPAAAQTTKVQAVAPKALRQAPVVNSTAIPASKPAVVASEVPPSSSDDDPLPLGSRAQRAAANSVAPAASAGVQPAAAAMPAAMTAANLDNYARRVRSHLAKYMSELPPGAKGEARVQFTVKSDGFVSDVKLVHASITFARCQAGAD